LKTINHIQLVLKDRLRDVAGEHVQTDAEKYLSIDTGEVKTSNVYSVELELDDNQVKEFAEKALKDAVLHDVYINNLYTSEKYKSHIIISKQPGVTDDVGVSAQKTLADFFNLDIDHGEQWIFSQEVFYFENKLSDQQLLKIAEELLGNPLINHFEIGEFDGVIKYVPEVHLNTKVETNIINIDTDDDDELLKISKDMLLALDLREMKAIQKYFRDEKIRKERKTIAKWKFLVRRGRNIVNTKSFPRKLPIRIWRPVKRKRLIHCLRPI
jgi:phosphoribosylformylglycinamidine synthase